MKYVIRASIQLLASPTPLRSFPENITTYRSTEQSPAIPCHPLTSPATPEIFWRSVGGVLC